MALSQNTLQELANSMGIQQRVATMSEAEKAQLRYIQIIKSTTEWQGDMARTLISPANAIRVLKQQFTLFGRALGRVFIPFVIKTIPYVMALTQVLTDLANKIASFFGYKITDIDYSSLKDISLGIEDIGDAAEETTNKLNTMLAPFDKLNVVQNEKNNGTSPLTNLFGDEYDLPEYDALAGLTKEMEKQVEHAKKNLSDILKTVGLIGVGFLGWKVSKNVFDFIDAWKDVKGSFQKKIGLTLALSGVALTATGQFDIKENFLKGLAEKLGGTIATGVGTFMFTKNLGISLLVTGVSLATQSYFDSDNFWLSIGERLGAAISFGVGTFKLTKNLVLSFAVSLGYFLLAPIKDADLVPEELKNAKKEADEYNKSVKNMYDTIHNNLTESMSTYDYHRKLYEELKNITDENGNVQKGYETRAQFILTELDKAYGVEYNYVDGQIEKWDELQQTIEETMAAKKRELVLKALEDLYVASIKEQVTATKNVRDETKKLNEIEQQRYDINSEISEKRAKLQQMEQSGAYYSRVEHEKLRGELKQLEGQYDSLNQQYETINGTVEKYQEVAKESAENIATYEHVMQTKISGDMNALDKDINSVLGTTDGLEETFENTPKNIMNSLLGVSNDILNNTSLKNNFTKAGNELGSEIGNGISSGVTKIIGKGDIFTNTLAKSLNNTTLPDDLKKKLAQTMGLRWSSGNITKRAEGGFPKTGEFFIAREDGPELVGKIGNQTAVANNDQITTSITNALVTALSGMNLGGGQNKTIVNIGGRKVYEGVGTYVDSENDRYGTNYIQV